MKAENKMTHEEIVLFVAEHLAGQKERAVNMHGDCQYRVEPENMEAAQSKCAAGCLIPEKFYSKSMEGHAFPEILQIYPELSEYFKALCPEYSLEETIQLIKKLQLIHDTVKPENWPTALSYFALGACSSNTALKVNQIFANEAWEIHRLTDY
jgi:hypothetical protein